MAWDYRTGFWDFRQKRPAANINNAPQDFPRRVVSLGSLLGVVDFFELVSGPFEELFHLLKSLERLI